MIRRAQQHAASGLARWQVVATLCLVEPPSSDINFPRCLCEGYYIWLASDVIAVPKHLWRVPFQLKPVICQGVGVGKRLRPPRLNIRPHYYLGRNNYITLEDNLIGKEIAYLLWVLGVLSRDYILVLVGKLCISLSEELAPMAEAGLAKK